VSIGIVGIDRAESKIERLIKATGRFPTSAASLLLIPQWFGRNAELRCGLPEIGDAIMVDPILESPEILWPIHLQRALAGKIVPSQRSDAPSVRRN